MGNPLGERTTINVKGVSVEAWERARACAMREGESMGVWLSGAINHRADMQSGPRELPPEPEPVKQEKPDGPAGQSVRPEVMAQLMLAVAEAYRVAGRPIPPRRLSRMALAADQVFIVARMLASPGKAPGQSLVQNGQSGGVTLEAASIPEPSGYVSPT